MQDAAIQTASLIRQAIEALAGGEQAGALSLIERALESVRAGLSGGWGAQAGANGQHGGASAADLLHCASCLIAARNELRGAETYDLARNNLCLALDHCEPGPDTLGAGLVTLHRR